MKLFEQIAVKLNEHPVACLFAILGVLGVIYGIGWLPARKKS